MNAFDLFCWLATSIPASWLWTQLRDAVRVERNRRPTGRHSAGVPATELLVRLGAATMSSYPGRQLVANRG